MRILFVDDERSILDGLRHRLRPQRQRWEMSFVEGGHEALALMGEAPFDVIVTDMRMPGMDGAALLEEVRLAYPASARIVLSGHAEKSAMLHAVATAHQFLPKPCPAGVLESTIERVARFQSIVHDAAVREAVGSIGCLPTQPPIYAALLAALADEGALADRVAHILRQDSALCLRMLQLVNSAYFQPPHQVVSIDEAVLYLGLDTIQQLALIAGVFTRSTASAPHPELPLVELQQHAQLAGAIAAALCPQREDKEAAFIAALLHDIGKLALATTLPARLDQVAHEIREGAADMAAVERRSFGVSHAEIGAYLLGLWQVPFLITEAIANHHTPARVPEQTGLTLIAAVHIADALACEVGDASYPCIAHPRTEPDAAYLAALGLSEKLPAWRTLAREIAAALLTAEVSGT